MNIQPDVVIIGSGPVGATYARILTNQKKKVLMIDIGQQYSRIPGLSPKNSFVFQRNMDNFTPMVQGFLHVLSVPPGGRAVTALDPIAWSHRPNQNNQPNPIANETDRGAINPNQNAKLNLDGSAASYAVGGMMLHWTACVPRPHPVMERFNDLRDPNGSSIDNHSEWNRLFCEAESLLGKSDQVFEFKGGRKSIRHAIVKNTLVEHYKNKLPTDLDDFGTPSFGVRNLPLAVKRLKNDEFVYYTGIDKILDGVNVGSNFAESDLVILEQHRVKKLHLASNGTEIAYADVLNLLQGDSFKIEAKQFIVACGAINSAQLLWLSGIRPPALGKYLIDHPMAFTQIVLRHDLVESVRTNSEFAPQIKDYYTRCKLASGGGGTAPDPLPIPMDDPAPNVWIPVSESRPWHCQIHKDSFHYGELPTGIDDRIVVDLRWFGRMQPREENRVEFEPDRFNSFGMPQSTFYYSYSEEDRRVMHRMMEDMLGAAMALGGFLPGAEPRFMPSGLALHAQGTCRMGTNPNDSVVDTFSRVHGMTNLYVGGNGIIPTANACNPTLTSVALALRSAASIR